MPTTTPNFGWNMPLVNDPTDANVWGGYLNGNLSAQDTLVRNIVNTNIGNSAPTSPTPESGMFWINNTIATDWGVNVFDGTEWVLTGQIDSVTHTFTPGGTQSAIPSGAILIYSVSAAPNGFLVCDGSAVSRATYATLFGVISTTYGAGDGSTTFNLPNLGGYFVRGWTNSQSVDAGRAFASTQTDSFASHTHGYNISGGGSLGATSTAGAGVGNIQTTATGSSETRPINIAMLYVIKT